MVRATEQETMCIAALRPDKAYRRVLWPTERSCGWPTEGMIPLRIIREIPFYSAVWERKGVLNHGARIATPYRASVDQLDPRPNVYKAERLIGAILFHPYNDFVSQNVAFQITMARVMLTEQENMWIATPFRASADPLPHTVTSPSAKSCTGVPHL